MRLGRLFLALVILAGAAMVAFVVLSWRSSYAPVAPAVVASIPPGLVTEGQRLVALGNCANCHTGPGSQPYAGGVAIPTPYGRLYSTNITPDTETGIGAWSLAAFTRAMRSGISRDGHHLYPAFPYPHYAALSEHEIAAIYAYLMTRKPVVAAAKPDQLAFPFNIRALVAIWNLLYSPATVPSEGSGGHLAEGIAHCGACHTPRNQIGAERLEAAYQGAVVDGWRAPALGAASPAPVPWTEAELAQYLSGGVAPHHGVAAGPMQAVTANLAFADPEDLRAIATYITALGGPPDAARLARASRAEAILAGTTPTPPLPTTGPGAEIYAGACATCHQDGWHTLSVNVTPLALASSLSEASPRNALRVILAGRHPRESEAGPQMPGFANNLTNQQLVEVLTYLRTAIAAQPAWPDLADTVARIRQEQDAP